MDGPRAAGGAAPETGSLLRLSPEVTVGIGAGGTGGAGNTGGAGETGGAGFGPDTISGADTIDRLSAPGAFRAVSWVPGSLQVAARLHFLRISTGD